MAGGLAQIPTLSISKQVRPTKIPGGFIWSACFELPEPARENGYIVQYIMQEHSGTKKNELNETKNLEPTIAPYWEAWEVKKGEKEPQQKASTNDFIKLLGGKEIGEGDYNVPMNDIFFKQYPAKSSVVYKIRGIAGFYHETLPSDFIVNHPLTGAGPLRSTQKPPPFWVFKGLYRRVKLITQSETESEWKDLSKLGLHDVKNDFDARSLSSWLNL